jgi:hypothetical protein
VRQNTNSAQIEHREVSPLITSAEIRDALEERYPEVTDPEFNLEHTGIAHEHPLIAIGVVLISSITSPDCYRSRSDLFHRSSHD